MLTKRKPHFPRPSPNWIGSYSPGTFSVVGPLNPLVSSFSTLWPKWPKAWWSYLRVLWVTADLGQFTSSKPERQGVSDFLKTATERAYLMMSAPLRIIPIHYPNKSQLTMNLSYVCNSPWPWPCNVTPVRMTAFAVFWWLEAGLSFHTPKGRWFNGKLLKLS